MGDFSPAPQRRPPKWGQERALPLGRKGTVSDAYLTTYHFSVKVTMRTCPVRMYRYGKCYKIVYFKCGGRGSAPRPDVKGCPEKLSDGEAVGRSENWEKAACNYRRAKNAIMEIALCNDWEHFVTLTLSPEKFDRYDLHKWQKALSVWIGNFNRKYGCKVKYLLIPEHHKDGAWHMHGLFSGLPAEALRKNCFGYLDLPEYSERFGFINFSKIKDPVRVSRYITKYVSKSLSERMKDYGAHLYYASKGLSRKECVCEYSVADIPADTIQTDFCAWEWFDDCDGETSARLRALATNVAKFVDETKIAITNICFKWKVHEAREGFMFTRPRFDKRENRFVVERC